MMHLLKPTEFSTLRVNPNEKYGLWAMMTCQYSFINYIKCTTLIEDIDCEESNTYSVAGCR
jgi:hypothetical protein